MQDTTMPIDYDAIVDEAARRMQCSPSDVRSRNRSPALADARHAAFWALNQAGLNPAQIGRLLGLNHSTVVHGLARVQAHPEWKTIVLPAVALAGGNPERALAVRLERVVPASVRGPVSSYVCCTLLGWSTRPASACVQGLWVLSQRPALRERVEDALCAIGMECQVPRILQQARLLGYV